MTMVAAGFVLGLAASLHCVAMCGPLMSAVLRGRRGRAAVIYHGARVTSYALLGVLTGLAGYAAVLAGAGRVLSVTVGLALIWSAAARVGWLSGARLKSRAGANSEAGSNSGPASNSSVGSPSGVESVSIAASMASAASISGVGATSTVWSKAGVGASRHVTAVISRAARGARARWSDASACGIAAAGVLNGLLPCGPVYAALGTAAALGDARVSVEFMLAFGAGTLPAVTVAPEIVARVGRAGGVRWRRAAPAMLGIVGLLLTARGLMPSHHHEAMSPAHALSSPGPSAPSVPSAPSSPFNPSTPSPSAHAHAAAHR